MRILQTVILILLLSSCISEKKRQEICSQCQIVIKDSIREVIKTTSFDTTLFISTLGKDLQFDYTANCCQTMDSLFAEMGRSNGTITAVDNGIKSSIFKKDKKIVFRCEADSLREVIKGLRTLVEKSETKIETKVLPAPPCDKPHKDWLDKYDRPWFFISLFLLLLYLGIKFGPKVLTLFRKQLP